MGFFKLAGYASAMVLGLLFTLATTAFSFIVSVVLGVLACAGIASAFTVYAIKDLIAYKRNIK